MKEKKKKKEEKRGLGFLRKTNEWMNGRDGKKDALFSSKLTSSLFFEFSASPLGVVGQGPAQFTQHMQHLTIEQAGQGEGGTAS